MRSIRLLNTDTLNLLVILQEKRLRSHNDDEDFTKKRVDTAQAELELKN